MKKNLCFATFLSGIYVEYIPVFVYSVLSEYPEYYCKFFVKEKIPVHTENALEKLRQKKASFEIIQDIQNLKGSYWRQEKFFQMCRLVPEKLAYPMFFIPYEELCEFKYVCTCDIDFLVLREKVCLHEYRANHAKSINLPFSNFVRSNYPPKRLTGWHFFETKPYYEKVNYLLDEIYKNPYLIDKAIISCKYRNGWGEYIWENEPILYWFL